jgi:hypothetical protein
VNEVLRAVKMMFFLVVTLQRVAGRYRCFRRWKQCVSPKYWYLHVSLYNVAYQKNNVVIIEVRSRGLCWAYILNKMGAA